MTASKDLNSDCESQKQKQFFLISSSDSSLKMIKNAFYIILKTLFVLKIFQFLS